MKTKLTGIERASRVFLAVLAGFLIWGSAVNTEVFSVETRVPVGLSVGSGYTLLSMSLDSVSIRYTGSGWDMLSFQLRGEPQFYPAEYRREPGTSFPVTMEIQVSPAVVEPEGPVSAERITPSLISCTIDTLIQRRVPVAPIFADGIPARYRFTSVEPGYITISGPESLVRLTDSVRTQPIQPGMQPCFVSLAPAEDMVAYSGDSVEVSYFEPVAPSSDNAVRREGLLTP